ncbi:hypothetical protein ACU686_02225 [Yinghuangia aomiensis]
MEHRGRSPRSRVEVHHGACAVSAIRVPELELDNPECVRKTFPEFHDALAGLRTRWGAYVGNGNR